MSIRELPGRRGSLRRLVAVEWRHGYRSARRDGWSRRYAARLFVRELGKGLRDLPAYKRETAGGVLAWYRTLPHGWTP